MKTIFCYGDSNTWGFDPRDMLDCRYDRNHRWCDLLEASSQWKVLNYGENGRMLPSTPAELRWLHQALTEAAPLSLVILFLGTNDLLNGKPLLRILSDLEFLLDRLREQGLPVLLLAPPPIRIPGMDLTSTYQELVNQYRAVARKRDLQFLDLSALPFSLAFDGVHLSEQDHVLLAKTLHACLKGHI